MEEIWKPVKNYEGLYEVSNNGKVKALYKRVDGIKCHREWKEHLLRLGVDPNGYYRCALSHNNQSSTKKVHRLVAEAFIPNPNNYPCVNHIDGNKQNNNVSNLEWCTHLQNMKHATENGLRPKPKGEKNPAAKLKMTDVQWIREHYKAYDKEYGAVPLGKRFDVHRKTIIRIAKNQYWKVGDADVKSKVI